jgi:hypothetical protein
MLIEGVLVFGGHCLGERVGLGEHCVAFGSFKNSREDNSKFLLSGCAHHQPKRTIPCGRSFAFYAASSQRVGGYKV